MTFHVPEKFRLKTGKLKSDKTHGNNGAFIVRSVKLKNAMFVIASDGMEFEHVSVSIGGIKFGLINRAPTWSEMCFIKDLFWDEDDVVMQLHPAKNDYINNHKYCLHLWKPVSQPIPVPDSILVGFKELNK